MKRFGMCVVLALASAAWADVPPADSIGCREKKLGDSCERDDKSSGKCVNATCTRNDYTNGPPPKQVSYDCLRCDAAPPSESKKCAVAPGEAFAALAVLALLNRRRRS